MEKKNRKFNIKSIYWAGILIVSLVIYFSLSYVIAAWQAPSSNTPPNDNEQAFLNIGTASQLKQGGLEIEELFTTDNATNLAALGGNVGIGTTTPPEKLTLEGGNFLETAKDPIYKSFFKISYLNNPEQIYVSGKYAFVTTYFGTGAVETLDISNPSNVSHVGYISEGGNPERALSWAMGIYVSGRYAYVTGYSDAGVEILDISNPANPTHAGAIFDNSPSCLAAPQGCALGGANDIYVSGRYAYVTTYVYEDGVEILDISNPANPTHAGAIFDNSPSCLAAPQGCALDGANGIYVSGQYAYVTGSSDDGVEIIDISNPATPAHVGAIFDFECDVTIGGQGCALGGANDIYVSGRYAYVTGYSDDGVEIIDISNPAAPAHVGAIFDDGIYGSGVGLGGPNDIFVAGKYAYVAAYNDDGIEILDISGIDAPTASIGNISASQINVSENMDIGNNLYIGNGLNVGGGGIKSDGVIQATSTEAFRIKLPLSLPGSCNSSNAGSIYFSQILPALNEPCYCNGSGSWTQFDGDGGC